MTGIDERLEDERQARVRVWPGVAAQSALRGVRSLPSVLLRRSSDTLDAGIKSTHLLRWMSSRELQVAQSARPEEKSGADRQLRPSLPSQS